VNQFAKLRDFCAESGTDTKSGLDQVTSHLARGPLSGKVAYVVCGAEERRLLHADLSQPKTSDISEETLAAEPPDLVVYVQNDALLEILRGELSPIAALLRGRLRYAGDEKLGVAIFRELASTHDAVFEPCRQPRRR